jgi:hypothetical protein
MISNLIYPKSITISSFHYISEGLEANFNKQTWFRELQFNSKMWRNKFSSHIFYNIKGFVQPEMSLNNREFLIWNEREGGGRN